MKALIDGDGLLYTACSAVEREVRWDDQNHVLYSNTEEAYEAFSGILKSRLEAVDAKSYRLAFSGPENFRRDIYPDYKAGRSRKPLCYARLLELIHKEHPCLTVRNLEADDVLGIWATSLKEPCVVVSDDKDLRTIPGRLYRLGELSEIPEQSADYNWLMQTLTGDTTDGYSGCPGIGEKTAQKYLDGIWSGSVDAVWPDIVGLYEAKGLSEDDALLNARLARILRASDWDGSKKEVKLWEPSSK